MIISSWNLGIIFLIFVTIIWSFSSLLTQFIYEDLEFTSPFILTYISSSYFALYLPIWKVLACFDIVKDPPRYKNGINTAPSQTAYATIETELRSPEHEHDQRNLLQSNGSRGNHNHHHHFQESSSSKSSSSSTAVSPTLLLPLRNQLDVQQIPLQQPLSPSSPLSSSSPSSSSMNHMMMNNESFWTRLKIELWTWFKPLDETYTHEDVIYACLILFPLWFLANILYNYSLLYTSISSSTIISNTSGVYSLFFSWLFKVEEVSYGKFLGVLLCIAGVMLVSFQDGINSSDISSASTTTTTDGIDNTSSSSSSNTAHSAAHHGVGGDVMAVLGAVFYSLFTTLLKVKVENDESVSIQLILGYVGLLTCLCLLPILVLIIAMQWDNITKFTLEIFGFITLSSLFDDVIADYLFARAVLLTTPTVANVGVSMTIPLAILTDMISKYYHHNTNWQNVSWSTLFGAILVILGFILVNTGLIPFHTVYHSVISFLGKFHRSDDSNNISSGSGGSSNIMIMNGHHHEIVCTMHDSSSSSSSIDNHNNSSNTNIGAITSTAQL